MYRLLLLNLILCGFANCLFSQLPGDIQLLDDDTTLRKVYREQSLLAKNERLQGLDKLYKSDYQKIYEQQFDEIGQLWQGQRAITNRDLHDYLQQVLEKVLLTNPQLRSNNLRVVITRDWWPNAYSLGDGSIAVNAGLFIFLENEAQLAYILCHELAHFHLNHTGKTIRDYVETLNSETYQTELRRLKKETYRVNEQLEKLSMQFVLGTRRHRRENEAEADRMAFSWLRKTGYEVDAIQSCLRLLDRVDDSLRYKEPVLSETFNFSDYPFRTRWTKKETSIFSEMDKEEEKGPIDKDSLKTHPDCEKRIALLSDSLSIAAGQGQLFLVDEAVFAKWKNELIPEISEQCFRDNKLSRHLYYSLMLLQDEKYRVAAAYSVARCLNRMYEKQQRHILGKAIDIEGPEFSSSYNELLRLLRRIRLDELAQISFQFCRMYKDEVKKWPEFVKEAKLAEQRTLP